MKHLAQYHHASLSGAVKSLELIPAAYIACLIDVHDDGAIYRAMTLA